MRTAAVALALLVSLAAAGASAQERFHVYEPQSRTAEELAPLVARLLGPDGAAIPDPHGGKLVLEGDPAAIQAALAALRELDAPLHQYRVESRIDRKSALDAVALAAGGWIDRGGLRVVRLSAGAGAADAERRFSASVVVLEGNTAEVFTGASQVLHTSLGSELVPVQSGFRVRPRALGDGEIELEITPVLADAQGSLARGGALQETGAATRVRVRPGETLAIAGIADASSGAGADAFHGAETHSTSSDSVLVVRVTPAGEAAASPAR
jgi:type II secretory pathway component GspD/PulD (secretin)